MSRGKRLSVALPQPLRERPPLTASQNPEQHHERCEGQERLQLDHGCQRVHSSPLRTLTAPTEASTTSEEPSAPTRRPHESILVEWEHVFVQITAFKLDCARLGLDTHAGVLELVDSIGSGPVARKSVWVRVPPPALISRDAPG